MLGKVKFINAHGILVLYYSSKKMQCSPTLGMSSLVSLECLTTDWRKFTSNCD